MLARFFTSKEDVERMHAAGPPRHYRTNGNALVNLVGELSKQTERNQVFITDRQNSHFAWKDARTF